MTNVICHYCKEYMGVKGVLKTYNKYHNHLVKKHFAEEFPCRVNGCYIQRNDNREAIRLIHGSTCPNNKTGEL